MGKRKISKKEASDNKTREGFPVLQQVMLFKMIVAEVENETTYVEHYEGLVSVMN